MTLFVENKKQLTIGPLTAIVVYDPENEYVRAAAVYPKSPTAQRMDYCPDWIEYRAFQAYSVTTVSPASDLIVFAEDETGYTAITFWSNRGRLFDADYKAWAAWRYKQHAYATVVDLIPPPAHQPNLSQFWQRARHRTFPTHFGYITAWELFEELGRMHSYKQDPPMLIEPNAHCDIPRFLTKVYLNGKGVAYGYSEKREKPRTPYLYRAYSKKLAFIDATDEAKLHCVTVSYPERYQQFVEEKNVLLPEPCHASDFYPY